MQDSMNSSQKIEKGRRKLLIILEIQTGLTIVNLILSFVGHDSVTNIIIGFIRLAYLALFLYVVIQYNQGVIDSFGIASIVAAILVGISFILLIITVMTLYSIISPTDIGKEAYGIIVTALVLTAIELIVSILQAVYSFRLSNLLKGPSEIELLQ